MGVMGGKQAQALENLKTTKVPAPISHLRTSRKSAVTLAPSPILANNPRYLPQSAPHVRPPHCSGCRRRRRVRLRSRLRPRAPRRLGIVRVFYRVVHPPFTGSPRRAPSHAGCHQLQRGRQLHVRGGGTLGCGCRGGGGERRPRRGAQLTAAPAATAAVAFSSDKSKRARDRVGSERHVTAVVSTVRGFGDNVGRRARIPLHGTYRGRHQSCLPPC